MLIAGPPERPIGRGLAGLACCRPRLSLPLYRQEKIHGRDGVELARSTLWLGRVIRGPRGSHVVSFERRPNPASLRTTTKKTSCPTWTVSSSCAGSAPRRRASRQNRTSPSRGHAR